MNIWSYGVCVLLWVAFPLQAQIPKHHESDAQSRAVMRGDDFQAAWQTMVHLTKWGNDEQRSMALTAIRHHLLQDQRALNRLLRELPDIDHLIDWQEQHAQIRVQAIAHVQQMTNTPRDQSLAKAYRSRLIKQWALLQTHYPLLLDALDRLQRRPQLLKLRQHLDPEADLRDRLDLTDWHALFGTDFQALATLLQTPHLSLRDAQNQTQLNLCLYVSQRRFQEEYAQLQQKPPAAEYRYLEVINTYRLSIGLTPLSAHPTLMRLASDHSQAMNVGSFFDLQSALTEGLSFEERGAAEGYHGQITPIIAFGRSGALATFEQWLISPEQHQALLNPIDQHIGISRSGRYWTQLTGS